MKAREVLKQLKEMGTAQNRKVYGRHGVKGEMFGVSYANLEKLRKKIKVDHGMAVELWASGNHDARVLATKIADPGKMTAKLLDGWVRDLGDHVIAGAFSDIAAASKAGRKRMEAWMARKGEWPATAGWNVLAISAMNDDGLADEYLGGKIGEIESGIGTAKNRVRYSMNNALIAIGIRNAALRKKAVAAAKRIGRVEVDHGETGCRTPDAVAYIRKAVERKKGKKR